MKKGRHRRFEEARALKRSNVDLDSVLINEPPEPSGPCDECGSKPGVAHASWCMADEVDPYEQFAEDETA